MVKRMMNHERTNITEIKDTDEARKRRREQRFSSKESRTSAKYLRRMEELGGIPASIRPFWDVLNRVYVEMENPLADTVL